MEVLGVSRQLRTKLNLPQLNEDKIEHMKATFWLMNGPFNLLTQKVTTTNLLNERKTFPAEKKNSLSSSGPTLDQTGSYGQLPSTSDGCVVGCSLLSS